MTAYVVPLPWLKPPLSLNDREHWAVKAKKVRAARSEAATAITAAMVPALERATVELHWLMPDLRHRDTDNPTASLKPAIDALVDCGVLPRDSWRHVPRSGCVFHPPEDGPRMWLVVTDIGGSNVAL